MSTKLQARRLTSGHGPAVYASKHARGATPFARIAFTTWGLMTEIIGAACVVFGIFFGVIVLTLAALVLFF
jgi:hypothetical protein